MINDEKWFFFFQRICFFRGFGPRYGPGPCGPRPFGPYGPGPYII